VAVCLALAGFPDPHHTIEFVAFVVAGVVVAALTTEIDALADPAAMRPLFVVEFAALLFAGTPGALVVAAIAAGAAALIDTAAGRVQRWASNGVTAIASIVAAGALFQVLGGSPRDFSWPLSAVPIAAAAIGYAVVRLASADVVAPLLARLPARRGWTRRIAETMPHYIIGASVAAVIVAILDARLWQVAVVVAAPLAFAFSTYADYVATRADALRRREIVDAVNEAVCVVDAQGRVTLWDAALDRLLGCPRQRALGGALTMAVPALATADFKRAMDDAASTRTARMLTIGVPAGAGTRVLHVRILPVSTGLSLLWLDVTDRARAERTLKRSEERLALAAEGANDGLWEWDLRTQEFFWSARWGAMLGSPAASGVGRIDEWTDRVHPEDIGTLKQALDAHLEGRTDHFRHEHRLLHQDGTYRQYLCRGVAVRGVGGRPSRIAGSLTDTTDHAVAQERLRSAGFLDPLTGLCNRAVFVEGLGRRLEELKERRGGWFAVLYLDLDRFKVVNDSLGHLVGDELLIAVSRRLESCLRPGDALARLGGDEFAILLNGLDEEQQANAIASRIQEALSTPFSIGGREVFTSASIGIAFGVDQYSTPDEIMRDADTAMYHAKSRGKARHELFDADMHARARNRLGLENDLRRAINGNDFEVHYQPIVSLKTGMCVGFESLVRWTRNGEAISPAVLVPVAEELGLIEPLGTWVLQEACRTFARWKRQFPRLPLECITVNASSRQLVQQNFFRAVEDVVHKTGLKPADLRIEITETALMDSPNLAAEVLRELRDFGVKIYLDDFGTGYSSLSHLHKLPVDALKIDRSFVRSLLLPERPAIVESILSLARTLNTSVVAEGIETDVQARELQRLGCTHAQGFLFSKPLSRDAAEALLAAGQPLGLTGSGDSAEPPLAYPAAIPFAPDPPGRFEYVPGALGGR